MMSQTFPSFLSSVFFVFKEVESFFTIELWLDVSGELQVRGGIEGDGSDIRIRK